MNPTHLVTAAAQYAIGAPSSLQACDDAIAGWVAAGAASGAQLLVFPEYAAIEQAHALGPDVSSDLAATLNRVADLAEHRIGLHRELARAHNVHILVGSGPAHRPGKRIVNAAQLVTPLGKVGVQDKLIITPFEKGWNVAPGEALRVFETAIGTIAIAICYDSEFPLLVRAMAEAGADYLLVPSCTERVSGFHRIRAAATARSLENQFVVITSPTVGDVPWSAAVDRNVGAAGVFVPPDHTTSETGVVIEGQLNEPGWVVGEIDLAAVGRLRTSGEMHNYTDWSAQGGAVPLGLRVERITLG